MKYVLLLSGIFFGVFLALFWLYSIDAPLLMLATPAIGAVFYLVLITFSPNDNLSIVSVHDIGGAIGHSGWLIKAMVGVAVAAAAAGLFLTMFIFSEHRLNPNLDVYLKQVVTLGLAVVFYVFYLNMRIQRSN